jgi:hypothetical protein
MTTLTKLLLLLSLFVGSAGFGLLAVFGSLALVSY